MIFKFFKHPLVHAHLEKILAWGTRILLLALPWQTIWITHEYVADGIKWEYGTQGYYAVEGLLWLTAICFGLWYFQAAKDRAEKVKNQHFAWTGDRVFLLSLLLLVLWTILSALWAPVVDVALQQGVRLLEALLFFLILLLGPLKRDALLRWFAVGGLLPALLGIGQFVLQTTWAQPLLGLALHPVMEPGTSVLVGDQIGRVLRAYGSFAHPNAFGGYLALTIAACSILFVRAKDRGGQLVWVTLIALQGIAQYFTFSRSAWMALLIWLVWLLVQKHKRARVVALGIFLMGLVWSFLYLPYSLTRVFGHSAHQVASVEERVAGYAQAGPLFVQHFSIGTGAGNVTAAQMNLQPGLPLYAYQPPHNVLLVVLIELGLVGALILFKAAHAGMKLAGTWRYLMTFVPLLPILFLDHYLWTSLIGLLLLSFWGAVHLRTFIHLPSPGNPQKAHSLLKLDIIDTRGEV